MPLPHTLSSLFTRTAAAFWWQALAAVATGVLLVLSFQPFDHSFLAWLALAPLLSVLASGIEWQRALGCGWLAGLTFFFFSTNWITHSMIQFGGMPKVLAYGASFLFSAIVAVFPALFAVTVSQLARAFGDRALLLAPFVWAATEWLRGTVTGATWNALGVSQVDNYIFVAWLAKYGGAYLISIAMILVSGLLTLWLKHVSSLWKFAFQILALCAVMALVNATNSDMSIRAIFPNALPLSSNGFVKPITVNVAVIQPNVPVTLYETPNDAAQYFENNLKLTRDAVNQSKDKKPDLIIWAESPLTLNYEDDPNVRSRLDTLAQETGSHIIFSAIAHSGNQYFNSAQTIAPPSAKQPVTQLRRYDKIRLVPFGEYVPFRPVLGYFVPAMVGDFAPGNDAVVNLLKLRPQFALIQNEQETGGELALERTVNFARAGTFICYEAAYPNLVRRFVQNGATLLINISNDAWFGNTAGARQHLAHARMRAIENDRDLVRVTNSGISALITSDGRVVDKLPQFTATARVWQARINSRQTFYTQHGDWFAILCALISAIALLMSFFRQRAKAA